MTGLHKTVKRLTRAEYRGRKLVIELRPGHIETLFIREAGRRLGYSLPFDYLYKAGARMEAESRRRAKKEKGKP